MALTVRFSIKIAIVMMMLSILRSFNTRIITTRNSLAIDTISSLSKSTTFLSLYSPFTSESEPGLRRRIFSDKKTVDDRKEDNRSKFSHLRMSNVYKTASSSRLQESSKGSSTDSNGIKNRSIPFRSKPLQSSTISDVDGENDETKEKVKDRPFTLPPGEFRPKQSLGQNFLSDQNYVLKIVDAFSDDSENGKNVVEIGPGPGSLSRILFRRYPAMTAIELDQRAVSFLREKLPGFNIIHQDVLQVDWPTMAAERNGRVNIIANLPYYITSQVLFALADSHLAINKAVVTMQWEVAERLTAVPSTKAYGIPSVVFQLYGTTTTNFKIPPSVFFPKPKVDSALVTIDFTKPHKDLHTVEGDDLRKVVSIAFRQRRKMLRQSLKDLVSNSDKIDQLSDQWATRRPEELKPAEFIALTAEIYGRVDEKVVSSKNVDASVTIPDSTVTTLPVNKILGRRLRRYPKESESITINSEDDPASEYRSPLIWRKAMFENKA